MGSSQRDKDGHARMYYLAAYVGSGTPSDPFRPRGSDQSRWGAIDLRADPTQLPGRCLLWLPTPDVDPELTELASAPTDLLSSLRRQTLEAVLGVTLAQRRFQQIVEELLTTHARLDGTRWKPLRVMRDGRYRIYLGGLLSEWQPGSVGASISENWDCANGASITCQLTWAEVTGDLELFSNQVRNTAVVANTVFRERAESDLATDDHYAEVQVVTLISGGAGVEHNFGASSRRAAAANTGYHGLLADERLSGTKEVILYREVTGTFTLIGNTTFAWATPATIRTESDGSSHRVLVDGTVRVGPVTDSNITGNLRTGILGYTENAPAVGNFVLDAFAAADLTAAGATHPSWNWGGGGW